MSLSEMLALICRIPCWYFFFKDKCSKTDNTWLFRWAIWTIALNYLNRSEKDHSIPWKVLNCRTATHEQTRALTAIRSTANHFPRTNFKRSRCTSNCLAAETITNTSYKLPMWSEETHTSNCNRLRQETTAQDDMVCKLAVRHKTRALHCKAGNRNAAKLLRNEAAILRDHLGPSTKHAKLYIFKSGHIPAMFSLGILIKDRINYILGIT